MENSLKNEQENVASMQLNTNKAGMEGLDTGKINEIIKHASKGSKFYEHKLKRQQKIDSQIEAIKINVSKLTSQQILEAEQKMNYLATELEQSRDLSRTIVHVDMDMFYAAVEMRDNPLLRDKPMAVGSSSMLSTSNYLARRFGVRAAMPGFIGRKLCPQLVIVPTNFSKYRSVSQKVQDVFRRYDSEFSPMSLDEAYLDITDYLHQHAERYVTENSKISAAEAVVEEIRKCIQDDTQLTASAGIAPNTLLAKVCSDMNKPNGQYYLPGDIDRVKEFIKILPIRKVSGIGRVMDQQLAALGVRCCGDVWQRRGILRLVLSETTWHFMTRIALGIGWTRLESTSERDRKSVSCETTFSGTNDQIQLSNLCRELCHQLAEDLTAKKVRGKTLTLKMKTTDFEVRTRAQGLHEATRDVATMIGTALRLLKHEMTTERGQLSLRLLGVRMSALIADGEVVEAKKQVTLTKMLQSMSNTASIDEIELGEESENDDIDSKLTVSIEELKSDSCDGVLELDDKNAFICPVCSKQKFSKMDDLNKHVDTCLNLSLVQELVRESHCCVNHLDKSETNSTKETQKLKRKNASNTFSKTKKIKSHLENTMYNYLQR